jgi:hypothetical protein
VGDRHLKIYESRDNLPCLGPERSSWHYELAVEAPVNPRVAVAFDELALAI